MIAVNWLPVFTILAVLTIVLIVLALPKPDGTPGVFWKLFK